MKTVKCNKFKCNKCKCNKCKCNKCKCNKCKCNKSKIKSRKINKRKTKTKDYKVGGVEKFLNLFKKNKVVVVDEKKDYDEFKKLIDIFIKINKDILVKKDNDNDNNCKITGEIILEKYNNKTCNNFMNMKNQDFILIENNNDINITKLNEHITKLNNHIKSALNNTEEYNKDLNKLFNNYVSIIQEYIQKEKDINELNVLRYNLYKNTEKYFINSFDALSIPKVINNIKSCGIVLVKEKKQEEPEEKEEKKQEEQEEQKQPEKKKGIFNKKVSK